ncbi:hypothetical protein NQ315_005943, partial [Exocentrus adspersus]
SAGKKNRDYQRPVRQGIGKVSNNKEDNALVAYIRRNPFQTAVKAREDTLFQGSVITALRRLKQSGLKNCAAVRTQDLKKAYTLPNASSGRFSVNVWGWISVEGPGVCWQIDVRLTGENYVNILDNVMLPSVQQIFPDNFVFQHMIYPKSAVSPVGLVYTCLSIQQISVQVPTVVDFVARGMHTIFWCTVIEGNLSLADTPLYKEGATN